MAVLTPSHITRVFLVSPRPVFTILLFTLAAARLTPTAAGAQATPPKMVAELLAADSGYAAAAANTTLIPGLSAMFAERVYLPAVGDFGRDKAIAALERDAANASSKVTWTPVRGGISADGTQGFTMGFMTTIRADGTRVPLKYLSYWVRGSSGWKVAAFKRGRRPEGSPASAAMPPAVPPAFVKPSSDATRVEAFEKSLVQAEAAFSRDAQQIGLGPAFERYGRADAMHFGGPDEPGFVVGAKAIAAGMGPEPTSPVSWGSDHVIVASSGDLGVSIGVIRPNAPPANGQPGGGINFFTVWRRDSPQDPWRYVAE